MSPEGAKTYCWSEEDVSDFLHSIIKRYPVGSLLSWRPEEGFELDPGRIGPVERNPKAQTNVLLDGFQRLSTLSWIVDGHACGGTEGLSEQEKKVWFGRRLVLMPHDLDFHFVPSHEVDEGFWIEARDLFDRRRFRPRLAKFHEMALQRLTNGEADELIDAIECQFHSALNSNLPHIYLQDVSAIEAEEIHERITKPRGSSAQLRLNLQGLKPGGSLDP